MGLLLSVVIFWPRKLASDDAPTKTWNRFAKVGASVIALLAVLSQISLAQAPNADTNNTRLGSGAAPANVGTQTVATTPSIQRVLIPVDAERKLTGSKLYIGEAFFRQLLELAGNDPGGTRMAHD